MEFQTKQLFVTVTSQNENGYLDVKKWEDVPTLRDATILVNTYRPKRGYQIVHFEIEYLPVLV